MNIPLLLVSACVNRPHPDKAKTGGEDSCFVSKINNAVGVADGVGGWIDVPGANASKYSRDLMSFSNESSDLQDSLLILEAAYDRIDKTVMGSSTATVAKVVGTDISIANVGDSGCSLYRNFIEIYHTRPTLHGLNFPYQLGFQSETVPANGTHDIIPVEDGDILVCASDGLWDNLYKSDIEQIIQEHMSISDPELYAQETANELVRKAAAKAEDINADTPFADEVRHHGYAYQGGKQDDITVVVARLRASREEL